MEEGGHVAGLTKIAPRWLVYLIEHGDLGVAIFFVLSGFVISHTLYTVPITRSIAWRFMLRRSLRLDPPYWFAIALVAGFGILSAHFVANKSLPQISTQQVVAHVFYVQKILGFADINPVFWTLCLEVQFYLVYVILLAIGKHRARNFLIVAAFASLLWPLEIFTRNVWPGLFPPFWYAFLLGVAAYWTWRDPRLRPLFAAFVLAVAIGGTYHQEQFALVSAATAPMLWIAAETGRIYTALRWRWLQFLGAISYSLYLTHNAITGASFRVGYRLTGETMAWEIVWSLITVAMCIAVGAAIWWLVEKPSIRLSRLVQLDVADRNDVQAPAVIAKS
jgi:peptidoglycan/LPS O-acetylase OafA/YrhL